jgi:hypothetical protein
MSPKDHVAVRLDTATLSRIDALKDILTTPWHEATRSDILRAVILTGLDSLEQEHRGSLAKQRKSAAQAAAELLPAAPRRSTKKKARPSSA